MEDTPRLIFFTLLWTAAWVAPLPRLGRWAELVTGLIPFVAFGLRVFAGFFVGVPDADPVRAAVGPLLNWINGRAGGPTVCLGSGCHGRSGCRSGELQYRFLRPISA